RSRQHGRSIRTPFETPHARHLHDGCPQPFTGANVSDCEVRWFYEHLLGLPDPPTATMALHNAIRTAPMTNFRYKVESQADMQTEGVVGLFRRTWKKQQASANFCVDEVQQAIGKTGEALVRIYMYEVAPQIRPAAVERPLRGVIVASA